MVHVVHGAGEHRRHCLQVGEHIIESRRREQHVDALRHVCRVQPVVVWHVLRAPTAHHYALKLRSDSCCSYHCLIQVLLHSYLVIVVFYEDHVLHQFGGLHAEHSKQIAFLREDSYNSY